MATGNGLGTCQPLISQFNGNNVTTVILAHRNDGQIEFLMTHAIWYLALTKAAPMARSVP